jgi:formamidopyrimidine-DNA glycosylase
MTGQLVYVRGSEHWGGGHPNDSLVGDLPDKTTRQHIEFSDGSRLYFNDLRKFGWMKLIPTIEVETIDFMKKVGPEPLSDEFTAPEFVQRIRRRNGTTVKAAILDQTVLAGVGNIYADESLWGAKIHPATRVRDLSRVQLTELLSQIKTVLALSIEKGGSTDKNYVDAEGKKGSYLQFANVFRLEGRPCPRCGTIIEKIRVAGRGTHVCTVCQVLDK